MKFQHIPAFGLLALSLTACHTAETATSGTLRTVDNAAHGVGRTVRTAGTGVVRTVGDTAVTAGEGIAEGDLKKSTIGTVKAAGKGTGSTVVETGKSHLNTSSGVIKDTGGTLKNTGEAIQEE